MTNQPQILLKTERDGILDCCYYGSYYLSNSKEIYKSSGLNSDTICFMRSLAKPLQTSALFNCDIINDYKISSKELAIFSGSHTGSPLHINLLRKILKKYKIKNSNLELMPILPLDMRNFNGRKTKLHNNCSGKHVMMVVLSEYSGFEIENYTNENHKVQKIIKKQQEDLSEYKSNFLTYDGCSTPLWGLPLKNIIRAYFNLFNNEKYKKLIDSILKYPEIFGGFNRLDSEIIQLSKGKLFSKVGAGGFVLVYNILKNEILLLKLTQNNNEIRRLILFDILNKIEWLKTRPILFEYNQKNQKVAKYCYEFSI